MRMPALLDTQRAKVAALAVTLGVVTALHSIVPVGTHPLHVVHVALAALYFVPIAASAAWFATRGALPVSAAAAGLHLLHAARAWSGQPTENANQVATAILFLWFGAVTGILAGMRDAEHAARLAFEEIGVYRSAVVAYIARPSRPLSRAQGASARPRTCAAVGHAHPSKPA
jgi:hypothetical protein